MAKVSITGLKELRQQLLRKLPDAVKAEVQTALDKSGEEMVQMARALAPVDDGDLRDSIKSTSAGNLTPLYGGGGQTKVDELQVRVTAGSGKVRYSALVEHGTKKMPAQPFFWPSYRSLRKRFRGRITRALNKALKAAAK